jgi:hypothetical protein
MTSSSRNRGRSFAQPSQPVAAPATGADGQNQPEIPPQAEVRWRRTSVATPDRSGAFSTTIRFREERYQWLHQVAATTGRSKSELVDEALELLAQRMGYGTRPTG